MRLEISLNNFMKWLKKNYVEIVLGLGLTFFLLTYFGEEYIFSVPLLVVGLIMLYKRHHRATSVNNFFGPIDVDDDELYEDAKEAVIEAGKASTSYIQRKLRVGYSRAARLMDLLEENGIISPADGVEPRRVLKNNNENLS